VLGIYPTVFLFLAGLFAEEFQKGSTWRYLPLSRRQAILLYATVCSKLGFSRW